MTTILDKLIMLTRLTSISDLKCGMNGPNTRGIYPKNHNPYTVSLYAPIETTLL